MVEPIESDRARDGQGLDPVEDACSELERILNGSADAFFALDRGWRFRYVNARAAQMMGVPRDELMGRTVFEVFPAQVAQSRFVDAYRRAMEAQEPLVFESFHDRLGVWLEVRAQPYGEGLSILLSDISERRAAGLDREQLYEEVERIDLLTDAALSSIEPQELLDRLLERLLQVLDADVAIVTAPTGTWVITRPKGDHCPAPSSIVSLRSSLAAELTLGDENLGRLEVGWGGEHDASDSEQRLFKLACQRIAAALTNARLHRKTAEAAKYSAALGDINELLHSTLDAEEVLRSVVTLARSAMNVEASVVVFAEGGQLVARFADGLPDQIYDVRVDADEFPMWGEAIQRMQPIVVTDSRADPLAHHGLAEQFGITSSLTVPLISRGELSGLLLFLYQRPHAAFGEAQIDFATKLATSLGLALENARLYAAEHQIAEALQAALVQVPERVGDITLAHVYRSAGAMEGSVGGDFYDVFELEDDRIGFVIGDVSGKGLGAAVVTSLIKNAIRAHAVDEDSPAVAMAKTNRLAALQTDGDTFATALFGVLNRSTGRFTYCSAGHPGPLLLHADGSLERLDTTSPLVGAFDRMAYSEDSVTLQRGETLVFYTDGVLEARHGEDFFGQQRLEDAVREMPGDPEAIATMLLEMVLSFSGQDLADDVALLVARYEPADGLTHDI